MAQGLIYSIHSSALVEFLWKAYYSPLLDHGKEVGVGKDMDRQETPLNIGRQIHSLRKPRKRHKLHKVKTKCGNHL